MAPLNLPDHNPDPPQAPGYYQNWNDSHNFLLQHQFAKEADMTVAVQHLLGLNIFVANQRLESIGVINNFSWVWGRFIFSRTCRFPNEPKYLDYTAGGIGIYFRTSRNILRNFRQDAPAPINEETNRMYRAMLERALESPQAVNRVTSFRIFDRQSFESYYGLEWVEGEEPEAAGPHVDNVNGHANGHVNDHVNGHVNGHVNVHADHGDAHSDHGDDHEQEPGR
ncbi:hypothetical protein TKK_0006297 [Trichogramma kaykai]|uniref:Uncharacterized protein n=1 Tax=Trichogramma kaykai TaxID=54128 RepID=A0ABD2XEB4_9HYME